MAKREEPVAPGQDPVRTELLKEMVREAERVIDGQLKAIEELDDKGESVIRLAVVGAVLGLTMGSLSLTTLHLSTGRVAVVLIVIGAGLVTNLVSLYLVVHAYSSLGGTRNAESTPDITDLPRRHKTKGMDLEIHYEGLLLGYGHAQTANQALMRTMIAWRKRGLRVLAWATVPLYFGAMVLVAVLSSV